MRTSTPRWSVSTVKAFRSSSCCISRGNDDAALALGFDRFVLDGDDLRRRPLLERKNALARLLIRSRGGIQYVEHADGHAERMFAAMCELGLEGIEAENLGLSLRPIEKLDQGEKPEGPGGNSDT